MNNGPLVLSSVELTHPDTAKVGLGSGMNVYMYQLARCGYHYHITLEDSTVNVCMQLEVCPHAQWLMVYSVDYSFNLHALWLVNSILISLHTQILRLNLTNLCCLGLVSLQQQYQLQYRAPIKAASVYVMYLHPQCDSLK